MASLRRWLLSCPRRCYSAAAVERSGGSSAARSLEDEATDPYCYTIGKYGKICFKREKFVPVIQYISQYPSFVPVPKDRLIFGVDPEQPWFTSDMGKEWMRSGFLAAHFAMSLGLPLKSAFVDGNVGIISGLNIIAFLDLDATKPSTSSDTSLTFAGFTRFLHATIEKELGGNYLHILPKGLHELLEAAENSGIDPRLITHYPELMPYEVLAVFFSEAFRILRRQMPVQNEAHKAHQVLLALDKLICKNYKNDLYNDIMMSCWLGIHRPKGHGLPALVGISAAVGLSKNPNPMALNKTEWQRLKLSVKKLYRSGGIPTGSNTSSATSAEYKLPSGETFPKDPEQAMLLDVHRHCMVHVVEEESVGYAAQLPHHHHLSFKANPMGWRDGVQLMLHRFPRFPHYLASAFVLHRIWERLGLETRFPVPSVFNVPSFDEKQNEC